MEHCVMNAEDFGDNKVMYNGMLFMGSRNKGLKMPVYCMIPEIGITYSIVEAGIYTDICATQDGVTFNEVSQDLREIPGYEYYDGNSKYVYIGGRTFAVFSQILYIVFQIADSHFTRIYTGRRAG